MRDGTHLSSIILWGPPGSGKTTIARLLADRAGVPYVAFSAVLSGVREVREVMQRAAIERKRSGRPTLLFVDEIHRFNRAQQDAFLSHVENGDIVLIGATTENPSFEVNAALLSRARVLVLKELSPESLEDLLRRALAEPERGYGGRVAADDDALALIAASADGDARRALGALEIAAARSRHITAEEARRALARRHLRYDRAGEEHFNLISALHKSLRDSDPHAGLYWLARMLAAGEEPLYVARRLVRFASEDVGLADPQALVVAMAAQQAVHFIGMPEGALALAQLVVYLAAAPKSNAVYLAYGAASQDALTTRAEPVPLWIRNAPTRLMKQLGYGQGYRYAHDEEEGVAAMDCLPDALAGRRYYQPTARGQESAAAERLEAARLVRQRAKRP
jgi:putative ATPase